VVLSNSSVLGMRYGITHPETPERRRNAGFDVASLGYGPNLLGLLDPSAATFPNVFIGARAPTRP